MSHFVSYLNKNIVKSFKPEYAIYPFLISVLIYGITNGMTKGIMDNYLAEIAGIDEFERGIVEFCRELPGLFLIFILAWMHNLSGKKSYRLALSISILGTAGLVFLSSNKWIIVFFLVINSLGEHIIMQVRQSISIEMSEENHNGKSLGIMTGYRSLGRILGFIIVPFSFMILSHFGLGRKDIVSYKIIYLIALLLTICCFFITGKITETTKKTNGPKIYFHKKYTKYYFLSIFYGARKQVFITFAPFVLVLQYNASASVMSLLFALTAGLSILFSPLIGKLIDKIGYKKVMVGDTIILVFVCFFYGFAHRIFSPNVAFIVVCSNYILDSIISLCSLASLVYIKDLSDNQMEVSQTISTGISVNHLISIVIAFFGGLIWKSAGIEVLFSISAVLGLINSLFAATIKEKNKGIIV